MGNSSWPLIPREHYLEKIRASRDSPFIKVITGIRRCGKSTLIELFRQELVASGVGEDRILYLNFELFDPDIPTNADALNEYVTSKVPMGSGTYLLFDEIQDIEGWEGPVRSFYDKGYDIYITGSNSNMLSSELSTKLSGRSIEITVSPLVFSEYLLFRKDSGLDAQGLFQDYIMDGGLPAVALSEDSSSAKLIPEIIEGVYSTVFLKDVVQRHGIRNPVSLENLMRFVMRNIGDRTSARKAANYITSAGTKTSHVTVDEYLDYLDEAYLALRARRIDSKTSEYLVTSDKFYAQDLGIRNHVAPYRQDDIDGILENIVFNELRYRYPEVCICSVDGLEVDFLADPKGSPCYFQVCDSIKDPATLEREVRPFRELDDNYPKTIITYNRYLFDNVDGIRVVSIIDWLLEEAD